MKNSILTLFILLSVLTLYAQDYAISFSGSGASNLVETVNVENLTQGKKITLSGTEILHLKAVVTANDPSLEYVDYPMRVYPNPSNGYCTIEFGVRKSGSATIKVFDTIGREITKLQQTVSDGIHSFQVSGLGNGIYTVYVNLDDQSYSDKIISNSKSGSRLAITYLGNSGSLQAISKLKSATIEQFWQYNTGDRLKFIGTSGKYSTVVMDIPTSSKTLSFNFIECTDADGNNYPIVQIGTQVWMAENLKTTKYDDGKSIPNVTDIALWSGLSTDAYCWYNNEVNYKNTYGALYNWYAVNTSKLAPVGWHVATDAEWTTLSNYLGGNSVSGGKLKETGINHWTAQNSGATNETGFTALPGGQRDFQGTNSFISRDADWWSSTANNSTEAWSRNITFLGGGTGIYSVNKCSGYSVRCILGTSNLPSVTTTSVSSITRTSATIGVNVTSAGGAAIAASGVCWSTSQNPTVANSKITGNGTGAFINIINGLNPGTVYYVRAYATNSAGTAYGEELTFTTLSQPVIITAAATNITQTTATCGGNIISDGGAAITSRGICWSTNQNPTTANNKTNDGTGIGSFTSSLTGLTAGTTYYLRAYSINSSGTAYGNEVIIIIPKSLPSIETNAQNCISNSTIASGGYIANDGGMPVTARGVCWSTLQNPTISNSKTIDGSGISYFTSSITGLTPGTTYYIRAYATNINGTAYGDQVIAITNAIEPMAKKYLALISVVNSWLDYEENSWEGVYPIKENDNIQIFQVCIWNIANPKVSLYKFDRTWPKVFPGGQAYVDYRESYNILNVDIPIPSSQAYLDAFKLIMEKIVKIQSFEHLGIDYKGHGTGGSGLFENKISGVDSEILLSYINSLTGKKIDYLDWDTNCAQGNFERVLGEYKYADYILASDLDRGGFDMDADAYFKFRPEAIYETFFLPSKSIKQCLVDMTYSVRLFWETTKAKSDMISKKVKQSISIYDSNKFEDFISSTNLKSSTYTGDILDYVRKNYPSQEQKYMDFRFYYVSNKDFFIWDVDSNGFWKYY